MTDKKFEELLKQAVAQCNEKEWEELSQESKRFKYKPSKEFEEKMKKLYQKENYQNSFIRDKEGTSRSWLNDAERKSMTKLKKEKKHFHMRKGKKRIILVAALVAILLCGSVFAQETIREWRSNFVIKQEEDGLRIEYGGKEKEDTREDSGNTALQSKQQLEGKENKKITASPSQEKTIDYNVPAKYKLKWVPEGYKKEDENSDVKNPYWYYMTYSNKEGDLIVYNQHDADYVISMAFDKQKDIEEEISICGVKGKYFTHEGEGIVIYEVNGVTYSIQSAVSKQELIKMLENRERIE